MRTMETVRPLPEQVSAMARTRRFYGYTRRRKAEGVAGLGIIDTDACLWARTIRPDDVETLYLVPSLPTIKMKPAPAAEEYEEGITEQDTGGFVCGVNRFVNEHPILAALGLAAALLLGTAGGTRQRRVVARRRR